LDKSTDTFFIDPKPIVVVKNFTTFEIYESNADGQKYIGLTMRLDEVETENWSVATEKAIGKQLAFILDNRLLHVAKVNSQISACVTALNRGDYSKSELENFKTIIESER
jgi:preprotein translocase subunit SecD